jgi:hypothetical protein
MSDSPTPQAGSAAASLVDPAVPAPAAQPDPAQPAPARARGRESWVDVIAHLVAAVSIGSVAPFLVLFAAPAYEFGVAPDGFELADLAAELVALACISLALIAQLRPFAWLVAAVGLLGFAGLYFQGDALDGQTLTILLVVVISLQFAGALLAFAHAAGRSRWAVAVGFAAGIAGGRDAVSLLVRSVRETFFDNGQHGDDAVFAALGVLVAIAGLVLLVRGGVRTAAPSVSWPAVHWSLGAVAVAGVVAVVLTRVWDSRLDAITRSYIGGMSDDDALRLQTWDQLARVGIAALTAAILVVAAQRWGGPGVARWVLVSFGTALLVAGVQLFVPYAPGWTTALPAVAGAVVAAVLVRYYDRIVPWEAPGLVLATGLVVFDDPSSAALAVGAFGFGLAVTAGALRLAGATRTSTNPSADQQGSPGQAAGGPIGIAVAAGLGLAAWVLGHQVVVPAATDTRPDLGGVDILTFGVLLAALVSVVLFVLERRRVR